MTEDTRAQKTYYGHEIITDNTSDYIRQKHKEGCLFLLEKYLVRLPYDWMDALMFIFTSGLHETLHSGAIIMDDDESERFLNITSKQEIEVFIISDEKINGRSITWNMILTKEYLDNDHNAKILFLGGENLRKFCDERNIFYKSALTPDKTLVSGSNLKWQKKEGEDCRKPLAQIK